MTVAELIAIVESLPAKAEVRLAHQPSWPFEYSIANVTGALDMNAPDEEDVRIAEAVLADPEGTPEDREKAEFVLMREEPEELIVYIAEGQQLGYLPGVPSNELGWR